ncbi:hypothetical protein [Herbaspirillum autotrophicum]|nr:hypothetical protein [Herbaspirillum autotrophicum]
MAISVHDNDENRDFLAWDVKIGGGDCRYDVGDICQIEEKEHAGTH